MIIQSSLRATVFILIITISFLTGSQKLFASTAMDGGGGGTAYTNVNTVKIVQEIRPSSSLTDIDDATANASSVSGTYTQNITVNGTLWYAWNRWLSSGSTLLPSSDSNIEGYVTAVGSPNITIGYEVGIFDGAHPTTRINNGDTVTVGQTLKLIFSPLVPTNIYWFGTGYSMDSPFGEWRTNATAPARVSNSVTCDSKDFVLQTTFTADNSKFDVYIPLVVNPAVQTLKSLSGLTCGALTSASDGSMSATCTVASTGTLTPTFVFGATTGKFYYRYYDYRNEGIYGGPGCYGNNIPLTSYYGTPSGPAWNGITTIEPTYILSVPEMDIPFTLIAASAANPPTTPTITCPASSISVNNDVTVTVSGSVPNDKGNIYYAADWLNNNPHDPNSGWTGPFPSGSSQTITKVGGYSTPGTYAVAAVAKDSQGVLSSWSNTCNVQVVSASNPSATLIAQDKNGQSQSNGDTSIITGDSATLAWTCSNGTAASINQSVGSVTPVASGTKTVSPTSTITYTLTCTGASGTTPATDSATVTVTNSLPDLTAGSVSPTAVTTGISQSLTATIFNNGGSSTGTGFYNFMQVATAANGGGSITDLAAKQIFTALAAGASKAISENYTFATSGTYSVRACADKNSSADIGTIPESNETNNCGAWTTITVGNAPGAINGVCASTHYSCTAGTSANNTYLSAAKEYTWTCQGSGGGTNASCTEFQLPTATLSASPSTINSGQSSTLTWSSTNANKCVSAGGFSTGPVNATSGTASTGALSSTTNYQITCTNVNGSTNANTTVTVINPNETISATQPLIHAGDSTNIVWSSTDTTSCVVSGPGLYSTNLTGSQSVTPTTQSTYTITCDSLAPQSITVNVTPRFQEF